MLGLRCSPQQRPHPVLISFVVSPYKYQYKSTMMKTVTVLLLSILGSALAAPAIVWKSGEQQTETAVRTSKQLHASDLFADILSVEPESSSVASVVFLLGRGDDGSESLSTMAAAGALPNVEAKYNNANAIHHHVTGVESRDSMVRDAQATAGHSAMIVSLGELSSKLDARSEAQTIEVSQDGVMSKAEKYAHKRARDMSKATVLIVTVDPRVDSAALDSAVVSAIEHDAVSSVVLTAVRSHDEVKQERMMHNNRRLSMMTTSKASHGRGLEEQQQEDGEENNNQQQNNDDMTGVYYVSMTPNILAGILFTLLFATITYTGVTCMGMIQGQDVYVKKLPPVGREA